MKKFTEKYSYIFEIVFLFIWGLIPLLWYKPGYIALGHDMGFPLAPVDHFLDRLYVWTERVGSFGSNQAESLSGFFIHGLEALLSSLGLSLLNTQKITFIFWILAPGISMYIFLRFLYPKKHYWILRLSGSLFYMLNHFFLQAWFIAERTKFSAAVSLPLITLFTISALSEGRSFLINALLVGLTLFFFNAGPGIPFYAGLGIVAGFAVSYFTLLRANRKNIFRKIVRALIFSLAALISFIFLNLYWIVPLFLYFSQSFASRVGAAGGVEGAISWSREISKNTSFTNLFRLQGIPDWYDNLEHPYSKTFLYNPLFVFLSFLWPFLAFSSFLFLRKTSSNKDKVYVVFFTLLCLVGIFFAAGSHRPSGIIYDLLLLRVPGFSILRTPFYKFGVIVWFSYSFLIAYTLFHIVNSLKKVRIIFKIQRFLALSGFMLFIAIWSLYNYPYFTGGFFHWSKSYSTMLQVPNYLFDFKKWIDETSGSSKRVLLAPDIDPNTRYEIYDWRYFSLSTIPTILTNKSVVANDAYLKGSEQELVRTLYDDLGFNKNFDIAKYLGIHYILVRKDFSASANGSYSPQKIINSIEDNSKFEKIKEFEKWIVYKFKEQEPYPLFYLSSQNSFLDISMADFNKIVGNPQIELLDSFFITESMLKYELPQKYVTNNVVKGICTLCFPIQTVVETPRMRILPNSRFLYYLEAIREERKEVMFPNPEQHIDYLLGNVLKKQVLIQGILKQKKEPALIIIILEDIYENFAKIAALIYSIPDQQRQNFYINRVSSYYKYNDRNLITWEQSTDSQDLKSKFLDLQWRLASLSIPREKEEIIDKHSFDVNIPFPAEYQIMLYFNKNFVSSYPDSQVITIDQGEVATKVTKTADEWMSFGKIWFEKGTHKIKIPFEETVLLQHSVPSQFDLLSSQSSLTCRDFEMNDLSSDIKYKVSFLYRTEIGEPIIRFLVEQDVDTINLNKRPTYRVNSLLKRDSSWSRFEAEFQPDKYTQKFKLKFCVNSNSIENSLVKVDGLEVIGKSRPDVFFISASERKTPLSQEIKFIRINQTKYLVSIKGNTNTSFLNFGQRFDDGWKLRPVDIKDLEAVFDEKFILGSSYNTEEYGLNPEVNLLDLINRKRDTSELSHFLNNGYNNSWVLEGKETNFIVEYEPQILFYRGALASGISLVILPIVIFVLYFRRKSYAAKN